MTKVTGGELVVQALKRAGVEAAFVLHGAHIDGIFQACRTLGVRLVDVRHESSAGFAAEGYARVRRQLGVAVVTAGPGFTNMVTSMANALEDKTPVLYICGSAHLVEAESNALQAGVDQVAIARPAVKWAHRVTQTQQIPRLVAQAIRVATSHPQGPVFLDIPMDVLHASLDEADLRPEMPVLLEQTLLPSAAELRKAADLLAAAERPVILAGQGVYQTFGEAELKAFAEKTGIPVFVDGFAHGLFPSDHPLYASSFYKLAELDDPERRPDLIVAVGVRFGLSTGNTSDLKVPWSAKIIHIDTDPREIGRTRPADAAVLSGTPEALTALSALLPSDGPDRSEWAGYVAEAMGRRRDSTLAQGKGETPLHPAQAIAAVVEALPADAIVVSDGAEANHWQDDLIRQTVPGSYLTHGPFGVMGMGLGTALGAKTALPDRPVILTSGDGAIGFTFAEFDTLARHGLPVVAIIMNNHVWGSSTHYQERHGGAAAVIGTQLGGARYDVAAAAFGCLGFHVTKVEEIGPALAEALASGRPACINIETSFPGQPPNMATFGRR